jgi:hypothetical protein
LLASEVLDALRRRGSDMGSKNLEPETPMVAMTAEDAADLCLRRQGVEPLRIVVMRRHYRQTTTSSVIEPRS